jgi:hypothetical protein
MISNGALDGDPYGVSPFQQVINHHNLNKPFLLLLSGKNIYDTTT